MIQSYCGLTCSDCSYKDKTGCPGCLASRGQPFHGACRVALCCISRNLPHCGFCPDFPCQLLKSFAFDKEHGDNGQRLDTLKSWSKKNS
ncbi:MAG: DUF3795 domain-containing protein [Patescibacteria group bacterium]|jgi:hypothetical protein